MTVTVSGLYTYPLKSGAAIAHDAIDVTSHGLSGDRLWMVAYTDTGRFVTQRDADCGKLALVTSRYLSSGELQLNAPGMDPISIGNPYDQPKSLRKTRLVEVWRQQTINAFDGGQMAAEWMSEYLGRKVRVVRHPVTKKQLAALPEQDGGAFADGSAVLFTSESSLRDLGVQVGMDRFRPNIVLSGLEPWQEDTITEVKIGDASFMMTKPCARCVVPTINQQNGRMEQGTSPMTALIANRKGKGDGLQGVFFGQNAAVSTLGRIAVGDEVTVVDYRPQHPAVANTAKRFTI